MNVILVSKREGRARELDLSHPATFAVFSAVGLAIVGGAFGAGMMYGGGRRLALSEAAKWQRILAGQQKEIDAAREQLQIRTDAMAMRLGELDAHIIRLDALGKRLTEMAQIDNREFDFDRDPPSGGQEAEDGVAAQVPDLTVMLNNLADRVELRDTQLSELENIVLARNLTAEIHPQGFPIATGFISSPFGPRVDPFTGRMGFHTGVDIAGSAGEDVHAVAAGVVTWAGPMSGYGNLVQINHGDGYATRYAHNERVLVTVGQTVKRGDVISLLGTTGESTGPHVHFEVLHNGRQINPMPFLRQ